MADKRARWTWWTSWSGIALCGIGVTLTGSGCQDAHEAQPSQAEWMTQAQPLQITLTCNDDGSCQTNNDCCDDTRCQAGYCRPYQGSDVPVECVDSQAFTIDPTVYCEWDTSAASNNVYTTPLVVELAQLPGIPTRQVVFTTWEGVANGNRAGTLRVVGTHDPLPSTTGGSPQCRLMDSIGLEPVAGWTNFNLRPAYGTQLAAGDLNGDGRPEIVGLFSSAAARTSPTFLSAYAFTMNAGVMSHARQWIGRDCATNRPVSAGTNMNNGANAGPSLYDLVGDLRPEIIWERHIFDADGCLLTPTTGCALATDQGVQFWQCPQQSPVGITGELGVFNVVEDLDADGTFELVTSDQVYTLVQTPMLHWAPRPADGVPGGQPALHPGLVAIADMVAAAPMSGAGASLAGAEIVSVSVPPGQNQGRVRIMTRDGVLLWDQAMVPCPGPNRGGPPTIADFDGDGLPEIGVAGGCAYAVYDPDCGGAFVHPELAARGGVCAAGNNAQSGVLWSAPVTDQSSNATGSTVFDFDADGRAEVVYRDECRLWVLDGATGQDRTPATFDFRASSGTGYEAPTVADVVGAAPPWMPPGYQGPTAAEIVVPRGRANLSAACQNLYPPYTARGGIMILQQRDHSWAPTLPQWHQHAYSVTNFSQGRILSRSDQSWRANWTVQGLNNFRANPVLAYAGAGRPDLTARLTAYGYESGRPDDPQCVIADVDMLTGEVCNRGAVSADLSAGGGIKVYFQQFLAGQWSTFACGNPSASPASFTLSGALAPGQCLELSCPVAVFNTATPHRLVVDPAVSPDATGALQECFEDNNYSTLECTSQALGFCMAAGSYPEDYRYSAGARHSCYVSSWGEVYCAGWNRSGQLGLTANLNADHANPNLSWVKVSGVEHAHSVSSGFDHTCALLKNSTVRCWGSNRYGQLGRLNNLGNTTPNPAAGLIGGLTGVVALTTGSEHTCALMNDGTVRCWGSNRYGQLGSSTNSGTTQTNATPRVVAGVSGATMIVAGDYHTCALVAGGQVTCWGWNRYGQLGRSTNTNTNSPNPSAQLVAGLSGVVAISAAAERPISGAAVPQQGHTCALMSDQSVRCWGNNRFGQLGRTTNVGTNNPNPTPQAVSGLSSVVQVAVGGNHSCALTSTIIPSEVRCWGRNRFGQLGSSTNAGNDQANASPRLVTGLPQNRNVLMISAGGQHSCALVNEGSTGEANPYCWGWNRYGQLYSTLNNGNDNAVVAKQRAIYPVAGLCGQHQAPLCVPLPEVCDQRDNDCDGYIDEGGVCNVCTPMPETCNGMDDDCDGLIDEGGVCPGGGCLSYEICGNGVDDNCNLQIDEQPCFQAEQPL